MVEIWKKVVGFEDLYCISNIGRLMNIKTQKILKGTLNHKGYLKFGLVNSNGKSSSVFAHRIIAQAFLNFDTNSYLTIDHIDGNKLNNHVSNLQILSNDENIHKYHRSRTGHDYPRKCTVDGCENKHDAKGFCKKHWHDNKRGVYLQLQAFLTVK